MAKSKSKKKGGGGGGGRGGGRWSVRFDEAAMGGASEVVGQAVQAALPAALPDFIRAAPVRGLGLYCLGVAFNRKSVRSVGAGIVLGRLVNIGAGLGGP